MNIQLNNKIDLKEKVTNRTPSSFRLLSKGLNSLINQDSTILKKPTHYKTS